MILIVTLIREKINKLDSSEPVLSVLALIVQRALNRWHSHYLSRSDSDESNRRPDEPSDQKPIAHC